MEKPDKMTNGMVFYLYQDGQPTRLVLCVDDEESMQVVMCLDGCKGECIKYIDFENEVGEILIENIYNLWKY